jgi:tripartite ATP-independent transporter DctM subunit
MTSAEIPATAADDAVLNYRSAIDDAADKRRRLPFPVRWWTRLENAIVILALSVMTILPIWESILRAIQRTFPSTAEAMTHLSVTASAVFVQHGTLIVGLIGAAIAARENRLLSLATTNIFPDGWPRNTARIIGAGVGAAISALLCLASFKFVQVEREFEGGSGLIAYGIHKWMLQAVLPIGFGIITLSVLFHSTERWKRRWIAPLIAGAILAIFFSSGNLNPQRYQLVAFILLGIATFLGAPIFAILGGSALILFWGDQSGPVLERITSIPVDHYALVTNPSLPTIPLFTLAGYFLAEGGASKRLVRVFSALFGAIPGGPAIVTALLCAFFTSFTGASGVTILALGGVLMPVLISARYSERASLGLLTGAGSLGMLFPPCLPLVLYAIIAKQPIEDIFLGAIIPGAVLVVMTAILGIWMGPRATVERPRMKFDAGEAWLAVWAAKWELLIPVVAMYALFSGNATPVEASAYTAFYAFLTQTLFHRDLTLRRGVPHVLVECGLVIGGVLLILGVAQGFTNYLITAMIPERAIEWLTASVKSPYVFLLLLNFFLLIVGGLMDVYPAIVVIVPLMVPIGEAFGINPIHLGVIFLANLEMGFLMPPLGINLLLAGYRFRKPIPEVYRAILPLLAVQFVGVLLITYVPMLSTSLPAWYERHKQNATPVTVQPQSSQSTQSVASARPL